MTLSGTLWAASLLVSGTYTPPNHHRVSAGETFAGISKHYGIGYQRLVTANPGLPPERLRPGTVILIPGRIRETRPQREGNVSQGAAAGVYRVVNGDTDWSIARRFGIAPSELRSMNPGVDWRTLQIGSVVNVPSAGQSTPTATAGSSRPLHQAASARAGRAVLTGLHIVRPGENDWIIARMYDTTSSRIRELNPGVEWRALRPGTSLRVPRRADGLAVARITTKRARVSKDNVIVRSGAKRDARRVGMVDRGTLASVLDRIGDWYKVRFADGPVGWIRGDLLQPVSNRDLVASTQPSAAPPRRAASRPLRVAQAPRTRTANPRDRRASAPTAVAGSAGSVVGTALAHTGVRYRWGGSSRSGFDCSGFTTYVFARHGKSLPRTSIAQSHVGAPVGRDQLQKGDLVFFKTRSSRVSHVGIYMGGGNFVHASSGGGRVQVNSLSDGYYARRYAGARRVGGVSAGRPAPEVPANRETEAPRSPSPAAAQQNAGGTAERDPAPAAEPPPPSVGTDVVGR